MTQSRPAIDLAALLMEHFRPAGVGRYGAVAGIRIGGTWLDEAAFGWRVAYANGADGPRLLPEAQRETVDRSTRFDIASLTKLFTALTALRLADDGQIDLHQPISAALGGFAPGRRITVTQLLTHTAGFAEDVALWPLPADKRLDALLRQPVTYPPGSAFRYSCIGYVLAGVWMSTVTGRSLDDLFAEFVTDPVGMADTRFAGSSRVPDAAATEYQSVPPRGLVRGLPHDELCWSLGGITGNAGLFSTLDDCGRLVDALLDRGDGRLGLSPTAVRALTQPQVPSDRARGFDQAMGFRINAPSFMGSLAGPQTIGHTGFTGSSIVIHLQSRTAAILLTNRVHPTRTHGIDGLRRSVADLCRVRSTT